MVLVSHHSQTWRTYTNMKNIHPENCLSLSLSLHVSLISHTPVQIVDSFGLWWLGWWLWRSTSWLCWLGMGFKEEHGVGLGLGFEEEHDIRLDLGFELCFLLLFHIYFFLLAFHFLFNFTANNCILCIIIFVFV